MTFKLGQFMLNIDIPVNKRLILAWLLAAIVR